MKEKISPKYLMRLVANVERAINEHYSRDSVLHYIEKWHESDDYNNNWENFAIVKDEQGHIDLNSTLHKMDGEILLQIAIDIGVETPDFIPSIPTFKNELKGSFDRAFESFTRATKHIEDHPDVAVGLANSTLESIMKEILKDDRLKTTYDNKKTLYDLTSDLLKEFKMFPNANIPSEINTIGKSLLALSSGIEALRSNKTNIHGKTSDDYVLDDALYAAFVINCVSTIGLYLIKYYKTKFPKIEDLRDLQSATDDLPF